MNNLSKVQEFIDEYWNKKTRDPGLFELFNENIISRTLVGKRIGRQSYQRQSEDWDHSFPDYYMRLESSEIIENTLIINYNSTGTFSKPYVDSKINSLEDTNFTSIMEKAKNVPINEIVEWTFIFEGDRVTRLYCHSNEQVLYNQLGILEFYTPHNENQLLKNDRETFYENLKKLGSPPLSLREIDCVSLTLSGFTARVIAEMLSISTRTVETHLNHAYQKLNCNGKQDCNAMMHANQSVIIWQEVCTLLLGAKHV